MAYNPNIPQGTDRIKVSRADIKENFTDIKTLIEVNHETFDSENGEGKHKLVTLVGQALPGAPAAGNIILAADTFATTGNTELFVCNSNATNVPITAANRSAQGYTYLASNLIMKWGSQTVNVGGGASPFIWPVGGNSIAFSQQYFAIAVVGSAGGNDVNAVCYVTSVANPLQVTYTIWRRNQFNVPNTDHPPFTLWFLAVGAP